MESDGRFESTLGLFVNYVSLEQERISAEEQSKLFALLRSQNYGDAANSRQAKIICLLYRMMPILIESWGDARFANQNGETILHQFLRSYAEDQSDISRHIYPADQPARDAKVVEALLDLGASAVARDRHGSSPLDVATARGRLDLIAPMLASVARAEEGRSLSRVMHLAAGGCRTDLLRQLQAKGLEPGGRRGLLASLCREARRPGADEPLLLRAADWLLAQGCEVNARDPRGFAALHYAAASDALRLVRRLLEAGADPSAAAADGTTPLYSAALAGSYRVMRHLAGPAGARRYCREAAHGFTPLHAAAYSRDWRKLRLLTGAGCEPDCRARLGTTPLHLACLRGAARVAADLLARGAHVERRAGPGRHTALHLAASAGSPGRLGAAPPGLEALEALAGARIAALPDYKATVAALLCAGAEPDARDALGRGPLHLALGQYDDRLVALLLEAGASVEAQDRGGLLPLHYALDSGNHGALGQLVAFGADINDVAGPRPDNLLNVCIRESLLFGDLLRHAVELRAAGLPIADVFLPFLYTRQLRQHHLGCLAEVELLKAHAVESGVSLYDVLHMDFGRRCQFAERLLADASVGSPGYRALVQGSLRRACSRRRLMDQAQAALQRITGVNFPHLCTKPILSHLSNRYLMLLIESAQDTVRQP